MGLAGALPPPEPRAAMHQRGRTPLNQPGVNYTLGEGESSAEPAFSCQFHDLCRIVLCVCACELPALWKPQGMVAVEGRSLLRSCWSRGRRAGAGGSGQGRVLQQTPPGLFGHPGLVLWGHLEQGKLKECKEERVGILCDGTSCCVPGQGLGERQRGHMQRRAGGGLAPEPRAGEPWGRGEQPGTALARLDRGPCSPNGALRPGPAICEDAWQVLCVDGQRDGSDLSDSSETGTGRRGSRMENELAWR